MDETDWKILLHAVVTEKEIQPSVFLKVLDGYQLPIGAVVEVRFRIDEKQAEEVLRLHEEAKGATDDL